MGIWIVWMIRSRVCEILYEFVCLIYQVSLTCCILIQSLLRKKAGCPQFVIVGQISRASWGSARLVFFSATRNPGNHHPLSHNHVSVTEKIICHL